MTVSSPTPTQYGAKEKQSQEEKIRLGREVGELYRSFGLDCCNDHVCVSAIVCIEQPSIQVKPWIVTLCPHPVRFNKP